MDSVAECFHPVVWSWFGEAFADPTKAQASAWPAIARGENTLLLAPTGSGKTLAAFLVALDRIMFRPSPDEPMVRTLYISPLKALGVDVQRNLRAPLAGIRSVAQRAQVPFHEPQIAVRSGDTPAAERQRLNRVPPDILITTPESLFLILTSRAKRILRSVETVIIDEIHSLVGTKRGAHLFLSLERLERLGNETDRPAGAEQQACRSIQRIGVIGDATPARRGGSRLGRRGK